MRNTFDYYDHDVYLEHHGIKGQKWGIRRYQNPDGTLTEEGKKRYLNKYGEFVIPTKWHKKSKFDNKVYDDYVRKEIKDAEEELSGILNTKPRNDAERRDKIEKQISFLYDCKTSRGGFTERDHAKVVALDEMTSKYIDPSNTRDLSSKKQKIIMRYRDALAKIHSDDYYPKTREEWNEAYNELAKAADFLAPQFMSDVGFESDPITLRYLLDSFKFIG